MNYAIADTGPLVALIDKSDKDHQRCVEWFKNFKGQLVSTEAVLTEALHLLNLSAQAQITCLDFFIRGVIELRAVEQNELAAIRDLVALYQNVPMDFSIYRGKGNKAFDIYPM